MADFLEFCLPVKGDFSGYNGYVPTKRRLTQGTVVEGQNIAHLVPPGGYRSQSGGVVSGPALHGSRHGDVMHWGRLVEGHYVGQFEAVHRLRSVRVIAPPGRFLGVNQVLEVTAPFWM